MSNGKNVFERSLEERELTAETLGFPKYRHRTSDGTFFVNEYRSYWWNTGQVPKPAEPAMVSQAIRGPKRDMWDWVVPKYKERSARGEIFNNPMIRTSTQVEVTGNEGCAFYTTWSGTVHYGDVKGVMLPYVPSNIDSVREYVRNTVVTTLGLTVDRDAMIAACSTEARGRIAPSVADALVSLGEMKETLRYLRNPFESGLKLADKLERKGVFSASSGDTASALGSTYLGVRYGLRPLVKDVETLLEALLMLTPPPKRKTYRAKRSGGQSASKITPDYLMSNGIKHTSSVFGRRVVTVRCGFLCQHNLEYGLNDHYGMRMSDIPSALWALIPLSFVVDWVFGVARFISAITPQLGVQTLSQWTTIREEMYVILSGSNYVFPQSGWATSRSGKNEVIMKVTDVSRVPVVNNPSIVYKGFDSLGKDPARLLDLIGLFGQRLNKIAQAEARSLSARERAARRSAWNEELRKRRFLTRDQTWYLPK